jgi:hypothetical protein
VSASGPMLRLKIHQIRFLQHFALSISSSPPREHLCVFNLSVTSQSAKRSVYLQHRRDMRVC